MRCSTPLVLGLALAALQSGVPLRAQEQPAPAVGGREPAPGPRRERERPPATDDARRPATDARRPPRRGDERRGAAARWNLEASARADVGYDTNIFQTDSATGGAFSELGGSVAAVRKGERSRLAGRFELSRKFYPSFSRANELEAELDLTASRDFGELLAGAGLRSAYFDLRLLDREGNLLPRTTFASFTNRAQAFADVRLGRRFYAGAEAAYRIRDYEETPGLGSLDYHGPTAEISLTLYLPARFSTRVEGTFEERRYEGRLAADAAGAVDARNPRLHLRRLGGEGRVRRRVGKAGLLELSAGLRRSEDLFEDELSYDQLSQGVQMRHALGRWRFGVRASHAERDFDLRRSGTGESLDEEFFTLEAEARRPLWGGASIEGGYSLYDRSTNDVAGGYAVGTFRLGIVHAF